MLRTNAQINFYETPFLDLRKYPLILRQFMSDFAAADNYLRAVAGA